jgi:hypothetical protein
MVDYALSQKNGATVATWADVATDDTNNSFPNGFQKGVAGCVQVFGTFNGGTVASMEVSNDGSNWETLTDVAGALVSMESAALFEFSSTALYIRPKVESGSSDAVDFVMVMRG